MTDDPAVRRRAVSDSISRKGAWLEEVRRNVDANGRVVDAELDRALAEKYGDADAAPTPEPQTPEPPGSGDGGARHDQDQPISTTASALQRRIAEAEAAGDLDAAMKAKGDLLRLRHFEQNGA